MPRATLPLLVLCAVVVALGLTWWTLNRGGGGAGGAPVEQDLAPFRRIEVSGEANVELRPGAREHVSTDTPMRGVRIDAVVRGDTLRLAVRDTRRWWDSMSGHGGSARGARIVVTYRELDAVALSGAVTLSANALDTPALRLSASGGSSLRIDGLRTKRLEVSGAGALKATIAGEATEQSVSISGAGQYQADRLASRRATVDVSGVGQVVVRVEESLDASISGAGSIEYLGDPKVTQHISGVGRIRRREAPGTAARHFEVAAWPLARGVKHFEVL